MKTRIIAFDPGGTTGVAVATITDEDKEVTLLNKQTKIPPIPDFKVNQLGPQEHHLELEDFLDKHSRDVDRLFVVYETFDYRNTSRAGLRLDSREYIGTIKGWCRRRGIALFQQTPAQAKGFVSDNILKELNLYTKAYRHANDGMRHLIYFVVNNDEFKLRGLPYEIEFRKQLLDLGFRT